MLQLVHTRGTDMSINPVGGYLFLACAYTHHAVLNVSRNEKEQVLHAVGE